MNVLNQLNVLKIVAKLPIKYKWESLAIRSIYDRKALFAKGLRKSEEFKHFNFFSSCFLWLTMSKICFD